MTYAQRLHARLTRFYVRRGYGDFAPVKAYTKMQYHVRSATIRARA